MKIGIVTGASSGLGVEFAKELIENHPELEQIWLIARREEKLRALADAYPQRNIRLVPLDIGKEESFAALGALLAAEKPDLRVLVSNAGVITSGPFAEQTSESQFAMLNVNAKGSVGMVSACLPYMVTGSYVVCTCSVSSIHPIPNMAVYSASKSFAVYFCRALREELKPRGVNVCALCPGNMQSEMMPKLAPGEKSRSDKLYRLPFHDMRKVARGALKAAQNGHGVYTPNLFYKLYRLAGKLVPHSILIPATKA